MYISRVNEYQIIPSHHRREPFLDIQTHKQLEAQNLRLIE